MFQKRFGFGSGLFLDEGAAGAGQASDTTTENSTGAAGNGDQAAANADQAGDGDKDKGKQSTKVTFTPEQQAAVDLIVKERLEREHKKSEANAEKARKAAEEEALVKNKEFETLAEARKTKVGELEAQIAELTPFKDQAEKYKAAMEKIVKTQVDKLPAAIKTLLERLDPIEKMQYIADHAKELNIEVIAVPETETSDSNNKLNEEAQAKAKKNNATMVKSFLSG